MKDCEQAGSRRGCIKKCSGWLASGLFSVLVPIIALGAGLRLFFLGSHNLWYDELYTLSIAQRSLLPTIKINLQEPLYYLLMAKWIPLCGESEFFLRLPSAVFGILAIVLLYKWGGIFFDRQTGIVAALILAVSPLHIWYAQEARNYTMATFLTLLLGGVMFRVLDDKRDSPGWWLFFVLVAWGAVYTTYYAFFMLISGSIFILLSPPKHMLWKRWAVGMGVIFAGFSPWLPIVFFQFWKISTRFWLAPPTWVAPLVTIVNFNSGFSEALPGIQGKIL